MKSLFKNANPQLTVDLVKFEEIAAFHHKKMEVMLPMCITAVRWANEEHQEGLVNLVERFGCYPQLTNCISGTQNIYGFACMLLYYTIGVSCILYKKYSLLNKILNIEIKRGKNDNKKLLLRIHPLRLIDVARASSIFQSRNGVFLSCKINEMLKPIFHEIIKSESKFEEAFDIFEYFISLHYVFFAGDRWIPWGKFVNNGLFQSGLFNSSLSNFLSEADSLQNNWMPLKEGLFDGDFNTFKNLREKIDSFIERTHFF